MRPPEFWGADAQGRDSAPMLKALLTPLSYAYAWASAQRWKTTQARHAPCPVVCVGNLTVGGAGKTPVTRALRAHLGGQAHVLSRGYRGRLAGPLRVTPDMSADLVGDEPLLHARDGPAWIARDRVAGAQAAAQAGAHAIIMDDGFQNPTLAKDLALLVIDAGYGIGNGQVLPAGPLREPWRAGLARAHGLIVLGGAREEDPFPWLADYDKPLLRARLSPGEGSVIEGPLVAFAGIARPEKFFDTLEAMGAEVAETVPYPDHHVYSDASLDWLTRLAEERGARLITTEKDHVRLSADWRARILCLPVSARFDDEAALEALLAPVRARMG